MALRQRRVVTGHDANGRAIVSIDGISPVRAPINPANNVNQTTLQMIQVLDMDNDQLPTEKPAPAAGAGRAGRAGRGGARGGIRGRGAAPQTAPAAVEPAPQ